MNNIGFEKNQYLMGFSLINRRIINNKIEIKNLLTEINKGNSDAIYELGNLYNKYKDFDNMKKYYLMAIEKNNSYAMNSLANYYKKQKDYDNMLIYYLMSIDQGNRLALYNLALYYKEIGKFEESLKYFKMASKRGDKEAIEEIIDYYTKINNSNKILKYKLKKINNDRTGRTLNEYLDKQFDIEMAFQCINDLSKKNLYQLNKLIVNYHNITKLNNKNHISQILNKKEECCICFENNNSIHFKCKHFVCFNCYSKINNCPLCRDFLS